MITATLSFYTQSRTSLHSGLSLQSKSCSVTALTRNLTWGFIEARQDSRGIAKLAVQQQTIKLLTFYIQSVAEDDTDLDYLVNE